MAVSSPTNEPSDRPSLTRAGVTVIEVGGRKESATAVMVNFLVRELPPSSLDWMLTVHELPGVTGIEGPDWANSS